MARISRDGFTLIELLIAMAIIGVLAVIAVPNYLGMIKKARERVLLESCQEAQTELHHWMSAVMYKESETVDFNCDGLLNAADTALRPKRLNRIPKYWDTFHDMNQPCGSHSSYDRNKPMFNRKAKKGSGQIRVNCNKFQCRIRGYTVKKKDQPIFDTIVALD